MDAEERRARRQLALAVVLAIAAIAALIAVLAPSGGGHPARAKAGKPAARHASGTSGATTTTGTVPTGPASTAAQGPPTGIPGKDPIPILMYHVIAAPPTGAHFPGLYVAPDEFAEQMHALANAGWHAVTLDQVAAYRRNGTPLPGGKPIVLTFDNGYNSQYTQALPVLRGLGWVGVENIQLSGLPPSQGGLGEGQVRGLIAAGWELDTQGFTHADLVAISPEALHHEVAVARSVLQSRYHLPVNWFCYPSGHYDARVIAAVRAAGYAGSTTVVPGWTHAGEDPYRLLRLRVLGGTSGPQLLSQLASTRSNPAAPPSYTGA